MDGEARMEVAKSVCFWCEFVKKTKAISFFLQKIWLSDRTQDLFGGTKTAIYQITSIALSTFIRCYVFNFSTKLHFAKRAVVFLNFIKMENCSSICT